jgi:hypothetical protein
MSKKLQDALAELPEMTDEELRELLLQIAETGDRLEKVDAALVDIRAAQTDDELRERMARWLEKLGPRIGPKRR